MDKNNTLYIHKKIIVNDAVVYNILVDGLLSFGYGTATARNMADAVIKGRSVINGATGIKLTKKKVLDAIRRTMCGYEYEVEYVSDSGREVLLSIV